MLVYHRIMCDLEAPRFLSLFHQISLNDQGESLPLDIWLENNVPPHYRVVAILQDKIVTDEVTLNYQVILEKLKE